MPRPSIHFVRQQDGRNGPRPINAASWKIEGCPANGPSIAADGRRVALARYTEAGDLPRVQVAF